MTTAAQKRAWRKTPKGKSSHNTSCRKYYLAHPEIYRKSRLKLRYGLTPEEFERLAKAQNFVCAICRSSEPLVVDHSHKTGNTRGLLCSSCNLFLGVIEKRVYIIPDAIKYLSKSGELIEMAVKTEMG